MDEQVTISVWLLVLLILLSIALVIDRILLPGVRWYLRRRVNRVINEVNKRLDIEVRPFQLTKRQVLIDKLVFDEKVHQAVVDYARENDMPREVAQSYVYQYAREIVPSFNAYIYFRFGYWLSRGIARLMYRIRVGNFDNGGLVGINPEDTVVFVMNHRSNMDYLLVSFLVAEKTALSYAVGEWARIWPLQTLIRSMGAFFVRRNSGNPLYRTVLERYVYMATHAGVCQAVFLEGGLSKDGTARPPRLGFLDYMLRAYQPEQDRDIVLVPVGINYDRVVEDRSLLRKLDETAKRRSLWFVIKTSLRFISKHLLLSQRNRWRRFGYASVNFGEPVSARQYCRQQDIVFSRLDHDERFAQVEKLADELMGRIQGVVPILPVPLMCKVILDNGDQWSGELELKQQAAVLIEKLRSANAPISINANAYEGVLNHALAMLQARGFVEQDNGLYRAAADELAIIRYYANSIASWGGIPSVNDDEPAGSRVHPTHSQPDANVPRGSG